MNGTADFEDALRTAIDKAEVLEEAKREIQQVLLDLNESVLSVSQNRLKIRVNDGVRLNLAGLLTIKLGHEHHDPEDAAEKPQLLLLIPNRNGAIRRDLTREVCRLEPSATGYPVRVDGADGTVFAEDLAGFRNALVQALSHPQTGRKLKSLLVALDKCESGASEGDTIATSSEDGES